ncbi:hypothetical protein [Nannocystis sp.]|uniref:hypothetical protein n=1 Tax=Nannocystis sp. TaxID=1962667 RepID=UPI0025D78C33|nr:hypothetical protein [Nannocystis sp.]MBK7824962.1 hypothetical protein [Nannocystis sp.]
MSSQRLRLLILCEDRLQQEFIERLADRWAVGPRQRTVLTAPAAQGSGAKFVLDNYVDFVRRWRSLRHDGNVGAIVIIDGDEKGILRRRQEFAALIHAAGESALDADDPRFAIVIPCWHIETWIAWLCGHRPVDERTCYKPGDPHGAAVAHKIKSRDYSTRLAVKSWTPPVTDEASQVPSLASARQELRRLGVIA